MTVALAIADGIARLTLERPRALNALNREMASGLERALEAIAASPATAVIVRGEGRAFCAGNDIKEMPRFAPAEAEAVSRRWAAIVERFARLPQVTIAAVHGFALGGGCMLAAAQDLRIAAASARFGLPEVTLGFNPSYGIARLLDIVGGGPGRDLLLTGRTIDAAEADALAAEIARHPRGGLAATKAVVADVRAGRSGAEAESYAAVLRADEGARGRIAAFAARSRPGPPGAAPGSGGS
ncbi:MAG TPA: enoyl-CoA hydratase/isomerase family protein [Candidatus Binatia bacterium]|nr:enoyl-CoA hydratase/isomerase family protein [Candidatus Binatia bacterium]